MIWVFGSSAVYAATLSVGPDQPYATLAAAVSASSPGDVIDVHSGHYLNDTVALPHGDLVIRGVGPTRPVFQVTEPVSNRKGIIAIPVGAGPVTIEGLHLEGAFISDADGANGAGIRMQGSGLTVRDCVFTDNQMGLLAGGTDGFFVDVEGSEFDSNGRDGSGYEHNVYIGTDQCASFRFVGNYSHHARTGHNLKSRCQSNVILYNRIMDEDSGTSSYIIDIPEGGHTVIVGNLLQQGPMAENSSAIVSYGAEGTNDDMTLLVAHNTIVNDKPTDATFHVRASRAAHVELWNNLFIGRGSPLQVADIDADVSDQGSLQLEDAAVLTDRAGFDYRLISGSAPHDAGALIESSWTEALVPTRQYVHPLSTEHRWDDGLPDVGAYGLGMPPTDTGTDEPGAEDDTGPTEREPDPTDTAAEVDDEAPGSETKGCTCASTRARAPWIGLGFLAAAVALRRRSRPL